MRLLKFMKAAKVVSILLLPLPAMAADAGTDSGYHGVGRSGPECPVISWTVARVGNPQAGAVAGVAWFIDMSGVSTVRGTIGADGVFRLSLTAVQGTGPTGTVTGHRGDDGHLVATLDGPGCSKMRFRMPPTTMAPVGSG